MMSLEAVALDCSPASFRSSELFWSILHERMVQVREKLVEQSLEVN